MRAEVQNWFARRTYTKTAFSAGELVRAKGDRSVSVVLPAKDEQETVGPIVAALRRDLIRRTPLIDELVVVDSNSEDDTARVAADAGAQVYAQRDILPQYGDIPGKGEALWKSLAVTRGDFVVFVDADLHEFDTSFVVGLLGPLIKHGVHYVKGCYDRPLRSGETVLPAGGGRVTELVARPLLNMHWPELAGLIQPLAGEYAATRECLEALPFVAGYGVEIGHLIDFVEKFGLDSLAQVDLGERRHRNSTDAALSRMAMQIQHTVHARLGRYRGMDAEPPATSLTQFVRESASYRATETEIVLGERPPMASVRQPMPRGARQRATA